MPHDRFYINAPLQEEVLSLEGDEFHHLSRVMRKRVGERVELINGRHLIALATIDALEKSSAQLTVLKIEEKKPLLPPLTLIQGLPKFPLLELIVQKGTELGVSTFYFYPALLSDKKSVSQAQKKRLEHITVNAMKQCGRLDLPQIEWGLPIPLSILNPKADQKKTALESLGTLYFGDLRTGAAPLCKVGTLPATLIIGPEKGLTYSEIHTLNEVAKGVSLAPYTLRTETAALAGLSILANLCRQD